MRILQFGRYDYDQIKGGVQYYADRLAFHWAQSEDPKVEIDEIVSDAHATTRIIRTKNRTKISVASYGLFKSVPISPGILLWGWKQMLTKKYDIIHINLPDPLSILALAFFPKKAPWVVTWHSDIVRQKFLLKLYEPLLKLVMRRVDRVIVSTPYHLTSCPQLAALKMSDKIDIVPFGIESSGWELTAEVKERALRLRSEHVGKFLLYSFGRHVYYKGYEYLVRAMKDLPNCHLRLGGSGPLTDSLKSLAAELKIEDRIEFIGQVPDRDLAVNFYACDVFCFPSVDQSETFGYTQVEAMMCGRPTISTWLNNGVNFVNLDGVTGIVVQPRDPKGLVQAVRTLRDHPDLREKYSLQALERARDLFLAEGTARGVLAIFRRLIALPR